ncbi:tRNA (N(6)-L-threonylcarbamoyladenosine(37)-C(2))-methylthiotransferase MtaB [Candidatus Bipolaricaulota bacterium]|nr:tRNA (N(6)-L-threonylcarbamoyladenosine(37)-C(2))-methylthiotransferase MtaB [Candidatus Bipolaricaulota bacterium]
MKKRVAFYTLGCKANQYDTEVMKEKIREEDGFELVAFEEDHDVSIINTCSVTNGADRKSRKYIRRAARKSKFVLVTGCYVTLNSDTITEISGVDGLFSNSQKTEIIDILKLAESNNSGTFFPDQGSWDIDRQAISRDSNHTRAFLKIQDGCSNRCSFCKVHFLRGPARSKSPARVVKETRNLGEHGFTEVVLTGINMAEYGENDEELARLIRKLAEVEEISRIRLSSINPEGITEELLEAFEETDNTCPYFHIPLQSGSNRILDRMNRGYTREYYLDRVNLIKQKLPNGTFGTDLMVGFPGERDSDFEKTLSMVKKVGFINTHVFRYSPREVTPASGFDGRVDSNVKKHRSEELRALAASVGQEQREKFLGRTLEMIVEEKSDRIHGRRGYSKNYLDLHLPENSLAKKIEGGETVTVKLIDVEDDYCVGKPHDRLKGENSASKRTTREGKENNTV